MVKKPGETVELPGYSGYTGYTFEGWTLDGDAVSESYKIEDSDTELNFVGHWKDTPATITVKYQFSGEIPDGYDPDAFTVKNVRIGDPYSIAEIPQSAIPAYYDFSGWMSAAVNDTVRDDLPASGVLDTGKAGLKAGDTVTFTGDWTAHKGSVRFDANGGTGTMDSQIITLAKPENLARNSFTRADHSFLGRAAGKNEAAVYADGASTAQMVRNGVLKKGETLTLYAVWRSNTADYMVQYYYDGQPGAAPSGADTAGTGITGEETDFSLTDDQKRVTITDDQGNEVHYNWERTEQATITADSSAVVRVYYLSDPGDEPGPDTWQYTVKYLEQHTNHELHAEKVVSGKALHETVTEEAVSIAGYNTAGPASVTITIEAGDNEIVFYYTVRQYAVSFNANGGSAAAGQTVNHGGTAARPANPTRSGYTFTNWNLGTAAYNFDSPVTRDITLIAQWRRNGGTDSGTGNTGGGEYHAAYHHHSRHPDAP